MGSRLRAEARLVGPATIQGRLYRVSWYPGAVYGTDSGERVHGEVYALRHPAETFAWLDMYEGIIEASEDEGEYRRIERPIRLATDQTLSAWVYLYQKSVEGLPLVPDGRWSTQAR